MSNATDALTYLALHAELKARLNPDLDGKHEERQAFVKSFLADPDALGQLEEELGQALPECMYGPNRGMPGPCPKEDVLANKMKSGKPQVKAKKSVRELATRLAAIASPAAVGARKTAIAAGFSEQTADVLSILAAATDVAVPGVPAGSAAVILFAIVKKPSAAITVSKDLYRQAKNMVREAALRVGSHFFEQEEDLVHQIGTWLESQEDYDLAVHVLAVAVQESKDLGKAFQLAQEAMDGELTEADTSAEEEDPQARAEAIADLLTAIYGDDALTMFEEQLSESLTETDPEFMEGYLLESYGAEVVDLWRSMPLWEAWNPDDHPRGKGGKFIKKNSPEAIEAAGNAIGEALKQPRSKESFEAIMTHLNLLTTAQIHDLKKQYGLKASGKAKEELVQKIAERLDKGRREDMPADKPTPQEAPSVSDKPAEGTKGEGSTATFTSDITEDDVSKLPQFKGYAKSIAIMAARKIELGSADGLVLKSGKKISAIASYEDEGENLYISYLASAQKGAGTRAIAEICAKAAENGKGIILEGQATARGFYEKIGMTALSDSDVGNIGYKFSPEDARLFAISGKGEEPAAPEKPAATPAISKEEAIKRVNEESGRLANGEKDVRGLEKAGFPENLDREEFRRQVHGAVKDHFDRVRVGMPIEALYDQVGKKLGLSVHDFHRALHAQFQEERGRNSVTARLTGYPRMASDHPRPEMLMPFGSKHMGFVSPGDVEPPKGLAPAPEKPAISKEEWTDAFNFAQHPDDMKPKHAALKSKLESLDKAALHDTLKEMGVSTVRPSDSKPAMLRQVFGRLDAAYRSALQTNVIGEYDREKPASPLSRLQSIEKKAESLQPNDSTTEIEKAVDNAVSGMDDKDLRQLAKDFGIVRSVGSGKQAIQEIKHKILEMQRARRSIQY